MPITPGTPAPDFALTLIPGEAPLRLSDYRGEKKVVLLFFPLAFTSVCTTEMCTVAEDLSSWRELGAEVIGISVDSPYVNRKFAAECGAEFPILSDFNREACTAYGVRDDDFRGMKGVAKRSAFVVGRDGVVHYAWVGENPGIMPPLDEIREAVAAAS